jgi:hypothetical protein
VSFAVGALAAFASYFALRRLPALSGLLRGRREHEKVAV